MSNLIRNAKSTVLPTHMQTIYLCGPITGLTLPDAKSWRHKVKGSLANLAQVIDPTRDSPDTIRRSESAQTRVMTANRLLHGKQIVKRNRFDIERSDVVLACFLGTKSVSIGSVGEIFWADAMGKPVIIVREEDNLHNHDMLNEIATWIFEDLEEAINQVQKFFDSNI